MLKLSYTFFHSSRVIRQCKISTLVMNMKEISTTTILDSNQPISNILPSVEVATSDIKPSEKLPYENESFKTKSRIVAAAFASLNEKSNKDITEISTPHTDFKIESATTVQELLSITSGEGISRRLALKIVSVLADWTNAKKIRLSDFENDFRFIKLCRVLTKGTGKQERYIPSKSEDLSTVLSVTADDEAARLIESITLPQMIKVMKTLSNKKRRSTLLLRSLAYNISGSPEKLDLKLSSDLLYSMSCLNFIDENVLSRVALDTCVELESEPEVKKSAVLGSILVSLGILKYKDPILLDLLTNWVTQKCEACRSQDVFNMFVTLATLNHIPRNADECFKSVQPLLTELEAGKPLTWLDHVWSKMLLNIATPDEISQVLSENFIKSLSQSGNIANLSTKLKLLNINAAAECLISDYAGNKLTQKQFSNITIPRRKEKIEMAESVLSSLKNLIQSEKCLRTNIDTGYGFAIDAECVLDDGCRPRELSAENTEGTKVAILALDYHDMTKGRVEMTGLNAFAKRILEAKGYKVLVIPYSEFKPKDKLISRVQFLEKKLKDLMKNV